MTEKTLLIQKGLLPKTKPGERVTFSFPDGAVYEFVAIEVTDDGGFEQWRLERVEHKDGSGVTVIDGDVY